MSGYFDSSSNRVSDGVTARAADVNNLRDEVGAGFDKLPSETELKTGATNYATDTGAADAYVISLPYAPASYSDGLHIVFKAANANTGASTINVNSLGVKSLRSNIGAALVAGDIAANKIYSFRYNATSGYFEMESASAGNMADVATVAGIAEDVTRVATNIADVTTAATNIAAIIAAPTEASNAAASALAAAASESAAAASYDSFDDRYLGSKAVEPSLDNDGNALLTGALYWNSVAGQMRVYDGAAWQIAYLPSSTYVVGPASATDNNLALFDGVTGKLIKESPLKTINSQSLLGSGDIAITSTISAATTISVETGTSVTAAANTHHVLTNVAATTVTLPASPTAGDIIWVTVANGLTTNVIARNGNEINGVAEDMTIDNAYATVGLRWIDATRDWRVI